MHSNILTAWEQYKKKNYESRFPAETIHEGFIVKHNTAIAYLDVAKAFDNVWHVEIIFKLWKANVMTNRIKIIARSKICPWTYSLLFRYLPTIPLYYTVKPG